MSMKRIKRLAVIFLIPLLILQLGFSHALAADVEDDDTVAVQESMPSLDLNCKSAILIEATTGKVLYEQNADEALPPASVTKVMTLLLVIQDPE